MALDIEFFKKKLEDEKTELTSRLKEVGRKNPENPEDWEPTPPLPDDETADENVLADRVEEFEERAAVEVQLEARLRNVTRALEKIKQGTYGTCNAGEKPHPIEEKRLKINPAARNCIAHMKEYGH